MAEAKRERRRNVSTRDKPSAYLKKTMLQLVTENTLYKSLSEGSLDGICRIDASGVCTYLNKSFAHIIGYKKNEVLGKKYYRYFSPDELPKAKRIVKGVLSGKRMYSELTVRQKNGAEVVLFCSGSPLKVNGKIIGLTALVRDITERKKLEDKLKKSEEQLRMLSMHLESLREDERKYISREIHDELGQTLAVLKMDLSWLRDRIDKNESSLITKTETMIQNVDMLIEQIRSISAYLRPGLLDDIGLAAAFEWQANEFRSRTGIKCTLQLEENDMILVADHKTAFFRVFQEALTNVALHSGATIVVASLRKKGDNLELQVEDNGLGITQSQILDPTSFGIIGMRERAFSKGGSFNIHGVSGKGTKLIFSIPLAKENGA